MTNEVLAMFSEMERGMPGDLIFPSQKGDKMKSASKTFFRAVDKIGLNEGITDPRMRIVFHSLRHSCASWLVNAGVEIPIIAKILGHKSLEMTTRYSHVNDASVKNAMQTLDRKQEVSAISTTPGRRGNSQLVRGNIPGQERLVVLQHCREG